MHSAHIAIKPKRRVQTCAEHSRNVAELAGAELEACGLGGAGYLAGLLHDCGKFTDEFEEYLEKAINGERVKKGSVIHTFAGVGYLLKRFHSHDGSLKLSDVSAEVLAACIGNHHGLIDLQDEHNQNGFEHRLTRQSEYDGRAAAAFHAECADEEEISRLFHKADGEIQRFFSDKIKAGVRKEQEGFFALGLLVRLITSAVVDADRTDTRIFMQGTEDDFRPEAKIPKWDGCTAHINACVAGFPQATPIQQARRVFSEYCAAAAEKKTGLYRIDLPAGGGKTLAALRFAALHAEKNGMRRIIYTAPLLSIIEQNAKVIRDAVGDTATVLEHHSDLLRDETDGEEISRTELLQENWEAQIIITTLVQLLNTLFSGKMAAVRRFHCLCESVIIIDEVQSLPPKMLSMFNIAVNFLVKCCGATVLLCSATQPAFNTADHKMLQCDRLISKEIFEKYAPLFKRTVVRDGGDCSVSEIAGRAAEIISTSDSLLIVCNTKREAAEIYQALGDISDAKIFHLSAGMCMAHRKRTLAELDQALNGKEKLICVSTQLIEAGVDVSFGAVIRLAAGLDNVVQAAGRCNRHGEHAEPQPVYICRLKNEKLGSLSEIREAQNALNVLMEEFRRRPEVYLNDLTSDAAINDYYTALYRAMARGAQDYPSHGQTLLELLSMNRQFTPDEPPAYYLRQAFRTAGEWFEVFDDASESVLVPYGEGVEIIERLDDMRRWYDIKDVQELLRRAKPYTVSLAVSQIERMEKQGMICRLLDGSVYVLNAAYYDERLGIKEGNDSCSTLIL